LGEAAKQSFAAGKVEDARKYAQELLTLLPSFRQDQEYGNAVHDANLTLGRIAVREGRLDDAKRNLIDSVGTPSARLMDYGPSMSLAKDLLEKERSRVSWTTLRCVRSFGNLDDWTNGANRSRRARF